MAKVLFAMLVILYSNVYSQNEKVKSLLLNHTYDFDNEKWTFVNGEASNKEYMAFISLSVIKNTYIEPSGKYLLHFSGNWNGGNYVCSFLYLVKIDKDRITVLNRLMYQLTDAPTISSGKINVTDYEWTADDAHCCPSYKTENAYTIQDNKFKLISSKKEKNN